MEQCSLLLDEADEMPRKSDRTEEIRGLLSSGHTRTSAYAIRNVKSEHNWIPKKFSTWGSYCSRCDRYTAGYWANRAIAIPMMRKPRNVTVEGLIRRNKGARAASLSIRILCGHVAGAARGAA
jgi:hypothetical protein